jgi:heptosyltransferase-2
VKILVRAANWIGDAVISLPALRAIRERFPEAGITVLARPWVAALYENERAIDRVLPLTGAAGARDWAAKWQLARRLRREHFDLAVLFPNSFESAALVRLAGIGRIVGYARDGRSPLLHRPVPLPRAGEIPRHECFYYLELLRRASLIDALPEVTAIRLDGIPEARQRGEAMLAAHGLSFPVIGVSPGAAYGGAKRWLPERFAEAARAMAEESSGSIAIFGSGAETSLCEEVARAAGGRSFAHGIAHNLAGRTTLREFIDMTAACRVFLTNDSGAMHIASASGVPSVTVFGPTDEFATGPLGPSAGIVREPVECAPCLLRECPIDHRCMTRVTAERVVRAAEELIRIGARPGQAEPPAPHVAQAVPPANRRC